MHVNNYMLVIRIEALRKLIRIVEDGRIEYEDQEPLAFLKGCATSLVGCDQALEMVVSPKIE